MVDAKQSTILIIDPSTVTGQLLKRKLQKLGCDVHCAHIGASALDVAMQAQPDVILLELSFEDPTGFEICEKIKGHKALHKIPIVIHTNRSTLVNVIRAIRVGASSLIVKPASTDTIVHKIHEVFSKLGRPDMVGAKGSVLVGGDDSGTLECAAGQGVAKHSESVVFTERLDAKQRLDLLLRNADEIKAIPHVVVRTLKVSGDECSGASELAKVIESDAAISTMVFKRANCVFYSGKQRVSSVKDAIVRIGFSKTRNMVLGISILKNFGNLTNSLGFDREGFWEHSLAVGSIAKKLVHQSRTVDPDLAFFAGLTHDVGKLIFDEHMPDKYESALEASGQRGISLSRTERDVFQINHTEVAHVILERWRLPEVISLVALHHNSYREINTQVSCECRPMVKLIYVANAIAKACRLGGSGDEMIYPIPNELLVELDCPAGLPGDLFEHVAKDIKDHQEFLNMRPGEDLSQRRPEFQGKSLILLKNPAPILDTYELYLSRNWGFHIVNLQNVKALDEIDRLEEAIIVLQVMDVPEERRRFNNLFEHPRRGRVLLLLDPCPFSDASRDVWPSDRVTVMRKPVDGRTLIAMLAQMCQETGSKTSNQLAANCR